MHGGEPFSPPAPVRLVSGLQIADNQAVTTIYESKEGRHTSGRAGRDRHLARNSRRAGAYHPCLCVGTCPRARTGSPGYESRLTRLRSDSRRHVLWRLFLFVGPGTGIAPSVGVDGSADWEHERDALLGKRISDLGLQIRGSRVERLVDELYKELAACSISFRPPVYLSDQWGCPDGTPLIGVPFYLVDKRLERIEAEMSGSVEDDDEAMRYLRHECGHAIDYAFHFHDRPDWKKTFGSFSAPYRERYRADPFSRAHVRHILGWYAQKHPDEDFAETFAVWLTPGLDWRAEYAGWPALEKLKYIDRLMAEIRELAPEVGPPTADDLPVESMHYTVAEHYHNEWASIPIGDARQFDSDLRRIFAAHTIAPSGMSAAEFIEQHYREVLVRLSYWTGEAPAVVRSLLDHLIARARALGLRVSGLEAATLIELTAFGTAVVMNYRHTQTLGRTARSRGGTASSEVEA